METKFWLDDKKYIYISIFELTLMKFLILVSLHEVMNIAMFPSNALFSRVRPFFHQGGEIQFKYAHSSKGVKMRWFLAQPKSTFFRVSCLAVTQQQR